MPAPFDLQNHVALITGANHGIGAATARLLAACGAAVVVSYLRIPDPGDAAVPELYRRHRALDAASVLTAIQAQGGRAVALEADLADAGMPARLFDAAEEAFGAVDILINNATGWVADTFSADPAVGSVIPNSESPPRPLTSNSSSTRVPPRCSSPSSRGVMPRAAPRGAGLSDSPRAVRPAFRTRCHTARRKPRSRTTRCRQHSNSRRSASRQMSFTHRSPIPAG